MPSTVQPLEQELCSMTMGCQPPKGRNHSNYDPRLENQIKINNKNALDCKRLVIPASSCKSFNVQHLVYPSTLSGHLLRVGKTLWQCKCLLVVTRLSVLVCKRCLGIEWMAHSNQDNLANYFSWGPVTLTYASHIHHPHQNFIKHACI